MGKPDTAVVARGVASASLADESGVKLIVGGTEEGETTSETGGETAAA